MGWIEEEDTVDYSNFPISDNMETLSEAIGTVEDGESVDSVEDGEIVGSEKDDPDFNNMPTLTSMDKAVHAAADMFQAILSEADCGDDVQAIDVLRGMIYLVYSKHFKANLDYVDSDQDMWVLLWLTRADPTNHKHECMRDYCAEPPLASTREALSEAKCFVYGSDHRPILSNAILKTLGSPETDAQITSIRRQFEENLELQMGTGMYRSKRNMLESSFPRKPTGQVLPRGQRRIREKSEDREDRGCGRSESSSHPERDCEELVGVACKKGRREGDGYDTLALPCSAYQIAVAEIAFVFTSFYISASFV